MDKPRLLRITTVPVSLKLLLRGQVSFFIKHGFDVITASADGPERAELMKEAEHRIVPMTRTISPLRDLWALFLLVRLIRDYRPQIVHTHTPKAGLLGMLAAWLCRVPVRMHTVAGLPLMEASALKKSVLVVAERVTYACANGVYPNSIGLKTFLENEFRLKKGTARVIGRGSSNGIDVEYFSSTPEIKNRAALIRAQHNIKPDEIVFCFVGRIVSHKGIVELVEAFRKLRSEVVCKLMLVGSFEPDLDPLPVDTLRFLRENPDVLLPGFQADVRPWMAAADAFVFPSYREGFPNVLMQAACLEVPAIASRINGCTEIIEDGVTGRIVPPKDSVKLHEAMLEVTSNLENARQRASRARQFVARNFRQEYVWQELLHEYKQKLS